MASESKLVGLDGTSIDQQSGSLVGPDGNPLPKRSEEEIAREKFEENRDELEAMMHSSGLIDANCKLCFGRGYRSFLAIQNRAGEVVAHEPLVCECVGKRLKKVSRLLDLKKSLSAREYIENPYFWSVK